MAAAEAPGALAVAAAAAATASGSVAVAAKALPGDLSPPAQDPASALVRLAQGVCCAGGLPGFVLRGCAAVAEEAW